MLDSDLGRRWYNRARRRVRGQSLPVWYAAEYRPPLAATAHTSGFEPRRADLALWYLLATGLLDTRDLHSPPLASWQELSRVHSERLLDSLTHGNTLARVFAVEQREMPVDAMLDTLRLACGGTISAARHVLEHGGPALNLLGGFHHAGPLKAGAMCALNDVAVAVMAVRSEGFEGQVNVIDLDAHPPDGIARCLHTDDKVWIGSLSGADWGEMIGVDETVLPEGTEDEAYLAALDGLLSRRPDAELTFVLAGGDVLRNDHLGALSLSIEGVAKRDAMVAEALDDSPAVWLPAGGYSDPSWRVLAGTATILTIDEIRTIPATTDPLASKFARVAQQLENLDGDDDVLITEEDLLGGLGLPGMDTPPRLLGFYTASGIELALSRYKVLDHISRLGYSDMTVHLHSDPAGDVFRLHGWADGKEHTLVESSLSKEEVDGEMILYVNWLTLRHPRASFSAARPALPGQDVPGLGMARETTVLLARMAERLGLVGVAFRPASFHVAYSARYQCSFADAGRQGRFRALRTLLKDTRLIDATRLVDQGKVSLDGEVY
ncbi:MAG: histone deacetylase, partial [Myxococcales bacterium]|nr:histone deacetylase [Myxococcales bacterium]